MAKKSLGTFDDSDKLPKKLKIKGKTFVYIVSYSTRKGAEKEAKYEEKGTPIAILPWVYEGPYYPGPVGGFDELHDQHRGLKPGEKGAIGRKIKRARYALYVCRKKGER